MCVTGQPDEVKSTSGRIVIFTTYMTSLIVMAAYSAFLTSSLAVQHTDLPFRDFQGLLNDGSYRLGVIPSTSQFNKLNVWGSEVFLDQITWWLLVGVGWQACEVWNIVVSSIFPVITMYMIDFWVYSLHNKNIFEIFNPAIRCSEDILSTAIS